VRTTDPINIAFGIETDTKLIVNTCPACGSETHLRRTHRDCPMNPANTNSNSNENANVVEESTFCITECLTLKVLNEKKIKENLYNYIIEISCSKMRILWKRGAFKK
jgi:hypothetical protein